MNDLEMLLMSGEGVLVKNCLDEMIDWCKKNPDKSIKQSPMTYAQAIELYMHKFLKV